jgi:hypothetical protein
VTPSKVLIGIIGVKVEFAAVSKENAHRKNIK